MHRTVIVSAAFLFFLFPVYALSTGLPQQLTLAATHWCPYSCSPDNHPLTSSAAAKPGIVSEYLSQQLSHNGIELQIRFLPWSRALAEANSGTVDGLLTAVPEESGELLLPDVPISTYQDCLFTHPDSQWHYQGLSSLSEVRLAYIQDYGYNEPVHSYILNPANREQLFEVSGADPGHRLVRLVMAGRADVLIEEKRVTQWAQQTVQLDLSDTPSFPPLRQAGCLEAKPFYLAINPQHPSADALIQLFNRLFSDTDHPAEFQKITEQYLKP
ncbi:hypothetical protein [Bacterioplanoides sp.]|uniref:hypothetical protein n=1 Tax=Bacterioplanoides sp. TaxID=2066072 RepID=UPI003B00D97F